MSTLNEVNRNEEKGNLYKSLDEADPEMFNLIIKEKDRQMKGIKKSGILKLIMFNLSKFLFFRARNDCIREFHFQGRHHI